MDKTTNDCFSEISLGNLGGKSSDNKEHNTSNDTQFSGEECLYYGRGRGVAVETSIDKDEPGSHTEYSDEEESLNVGDAENAEGITALLGAKIQDEEEDGQEDLNLDRSSDLSITRGGKAVQQQSEPRYEDFSDEDSDSDEDMEHMCLEDLEDLEMDQDENSREGEQHPTPQIQHAADASESPTLSPTVQYDSYSFPNRYNAAADAPISQTSPITPNSASTISATSSTPTYPPGLNIRQAHDITLNTNLHYSPPSFNSPYDDFIRVNGQIVLPVLTGEGDAEASLRSHRILGKHRVKKHSRLRTLWIPISDDEVFRTWGSQF